MPRHADLTTLTRADIQKAEELFKPSRSVSQLTKAAAVDALKVLHDILAHSEDKYRVQAASALIQAHCKFESMKAEKETITVASELSHEERVKQLAAALRSPPPELAEALELIRKEQSGD